MATIAEMAEAGYLAFEECYQQEWLQKGYGISEHCIIRDFNEISEVGRQAWLKAATIIWHMGFSENWRKEEAHTND